MFFIHIGQRKTGTTTLQNFFVRNSAALGRAGVCYSDIGREPLKERKRDSLKRARPRINAMSHRKIVQALTTEDPEGSVKGVLQELGEESRSKPDRKFLLSSESFEALPRQGIERLGGIIAPVHGVYVFAYVRNLADQKVSFYNQRTTSGANTRDFDSFCEKQTYVDGGYKRIADWSGVFGRNHVKVTPLDTLVGETALIDDALAFMGVERDHLVGLDPLSLRRQNSSLGWKVTEIYRAISGLFKQSQLHHGLMASCMRVADEMDLSRERGQYLTRVQTIELWNDYVRELEDLNRLIRDPIAIPQFPDPPERPFLPCVAAIPMHERVEFAERLSESRISRRCPKELLLSSLQAIR